MDGRGGMELETRGRGFRVAVVFRSTYSKLLPRVGLVRERWERWGGGWDEERYAHDEIAVVGEIRCMYSI